MPVFQAYNTQKTTGNNLVSGGFGVSKNEVLYFFQKR